jgi:hypothetical protein
LGILTFLWLFFFRSSVWNCAQVALYFTPLIYNLFLFISRDIVLGERLRPEAISRCFNPIPSPNAISSLSLKVKWLYLLMPSDVFFSVTVLLSVVLW